MWSRLGTDGNFIYNIKKDVDCILIQISNFKRLWCRNYNLIDLIRLFKEQNPLIEAEDQNLKLKIFQLMEDDKVLPSVAVSADNMSADLQLRMPMKSVDITLNMELTLCSAERMYEELTAYLFASLVSSVAIQKNLASVIREKEKELNEFRAEGYEIKRTSLISTPFRFEGPKMLDMDVLSHPAKYWNEDIALVVSSENAASTTSSQYKEVEVLDCNIKQEAATNNEKNGIIVQSMLNETLMDTPKEQKREKRRRLIKKRSTIKF